MNRVGTGPGPSSATVTSSKPSTGQGSDRLSTVHARAERHLLPSP